jgi:predicted phosphodiesterase
LGLIVKLALISEVHANLEALQATLADIASQPVDRIVCLGDIVGYNAHPHECIALLRHVDALCVAGNHDRAVTGQIATDTFNRTAARAVAWTRERLTCDDVAFLAALPLKAVVHGALVAVHGALHPQTGCEIVRLDNAEHRALSLEALIDHPSGARICAFGHTHELAIYEFRNGRTALRSEEELRLRDDAYYLVNPGAIGQPRSADRRASYMIADLAERTLRVRRVAYDLSIPLAATRKAGLAPRFSLRSAISQQLRGLRRSKFVRRIAVN